MQRSSHPLSTFELEIKPLSEARGGSVICAGAVRRTDKGAGARGQGAGGNGLSKKTAKCTACIRQTEYFGRIVTVTRTDAEAAVT